MKVKMDIDMEIAKLDEKESQVQITKESHLPS